MRLSSCCFFLLLISLQCEAADYMRCSLSSNPLKEPEKVTELAKAQTPLSTHGHTFLQLEDKTSGTTVRIAEIDAKIYYDVYLNGKFATALFTLISLDSAIEFDWGIKGENDSVTRYLVACSLEGEDFKGILGDQIVISTNMLEQHIDAKALAQSASQNASALEQCFLLGRLKANSWDTLYILERSQRYFSDDGRYAFGQYKNAMDYVEKICRSSLPNAKAVLGLSQMASSGYILMMNDFNSMGTATNP